MSTSPSAARPGVDKKHLTTSILLCHVEDLRGAADAGLRTAYIPRPLEWGPAIRPCRRRTGSTSPPSTFPTWPGNLADSSRSDAARPIAGRGSS